MVPDFPKNIQYIYLIFINILRCPAPGWCGSAFRSLLVICAISCSPKLKENKHCNKIKNPYSLEKSEYKCNS